MATPNYGLTDYDAEAQDIERRRKYAEMLSQQSMEPIQQQTAGGWVTPISWTQGLAKALQGLSGRMGQDQATKEQKALAERLGNERQQTLAKALQMAQGTPGTPDEEQGIYGGPGMAAKAPDVMGSLNVLASSKVPDLAQVGTTSLLSRMLPKEPKWQVSERFNPQTGRQEKILIDLNNPSNTMPFGGQEAPKFKPLTTVGVNGAPQTIFYDETKPPTTPQAQPLSGFMGQLQSAGLLTPEMASNPRIQELLSGYFAKEGGQLTPESAMRLGIQLAELRNSGTNTAFNTGGGTTAPAGVQSFSLFGNTPSSPPFRNAPSAPVATPSGPIAVPQGGQPAGLTPKARADMAAEQAKAQQAAKQNLPQFEAKVNQAINTVDNFLKHPGFSNVVGATMTPGLRFVPGTDAAGADAIFDQIKGQQFLQAFESLKGGGQITEVEGKKATDAIAAMSRSQSESDFRKAAQDFKDAMQSALTRAKVQAGQSVAPTAQPAAGDVMRKADEIIMRSQNGRR